MLRDYALFLRDHHLQEVAEENLRLATEMDIPLLRMFAAMPPEQLLAQSVETMRVFLTDLAEGRAKEAADASLKAWEEDKLPGISKNDIAPSDLVLVYAAQKQAILKFLPLYAPGAEKIIPVVNQLEAYYVETQRGAFEFFAKLRQEAGEREALLRLEKEATERHSEELQAMNEELQSQQEELETLYDQLQQQNERIEAEVAERTEELARSESQFRAVFDKAAIGMAMVSLAGQVLEANRAMQIMLGYTPEEFQHMRFAEVIRQEDLEDASKHFQDLVSGTVDRYQTERPYRCKDGGLMWAGSR